MTVLDIFAWIVLIVLILTALIGWVALARIPGQIAAKRHHQHAEAAAVAGWVGAISLGVFWPLALIWAFMSPGLKEESLRSSEEEAP